MASELSEARKAVARGRADEALVHLWIAVEPARLAGDVGELAMVVASRSASASSATRASGGTPSASFEAVQRAANGDGGFVPEEEAAAEVGDAESEPGGRLARYVLPLIFLIVVIVNVLAGLLGDGD